MCAAIDTKCFLVTAHQIIWLLRQPMTSLMSKKNSYKLIFMKFSIKLFSSFVLLTTSNIKFNSIRTNCMVGAQVYGVTALQYF